MTRKDQGAAAGWLFIIGAVIAVVLTTVSSYVAFRWVHEFVMGDKR